jgi:hypothetical protein
MRKRSTISRSRPAAVAASMNGCLPSGELVEQFCAFQRKEGRRREDYRWSLEQFLAFLKAREGRLARMADLTTPTIQGWLDEMAAGDLGVNTLPCRLSTLSAREGDPGPAALLVDVGPAARGLCPPAPPGRTARRGIVLTIARYWRRALLSLASLAFTFFVLEVGFRGYQYLALPRALYDAIAAITPTGPATNDQFRFDEHTGYLYTPNFVGERGAPWSSHWRTNRHGYVSQFDYPVQKPPGEYRIAVVGDSMPRTSPTTCAGPRCSRRS